MVDDSIKKIILDNIIKIEAEIHNSENETQALIMARDELRLQLNLPKLKEKYEGKYFKCVNSYGDKNDGWYTYYYVTKVNGLDDCNVILIEMTIDDEIYITEKKYYSFHLLGDPISDKHFLDEINRIHFKIKSLISLCLVNNKEIPS